MTSQVQTKIASLTAELNTATELYYREFRPTLSDQQFDMKLRELAVLEKEHPENVLPESPVGRVGSDLDPAFEIGRAHV